GFDNNLLREKMIKAIFFDAAGILYTRGGHTETYALDLLDKMGFSNDLSPDQLNKQLALRSQANKGVISHETYWDNFLLMRNVLDPQQRKNFTLQITNYSNDVQPVPGAREALAKMKELGLLLGIITDTMYPVEWKMRRLEKAGVAEFIDVVACSTELGVHKPDPAVYSYALQQAHLISGESAFVGHLGIEVQGAKTAGMVTIAINHDEDSQADYYCNSLMDILKLPIINNTNLESKT
ncbi:MAG: HAD family hydrolase, partial [Anaerolineaceae bacterium]